MLTRRSSIVALLTLVPGAAVGLASGTASAAPMCLPNACAYGSVTIPGSGGGTSGGTGDGGGDSGGGPGLGCPTVGGQVVCAPNAPAPRAPRQIPTRELVMQARQELELPVPKIGTAPSPRSYIQIKTGLWVTDVGDKTAEAAVPGQDVTVTATVANVKWEMGDGTGAFDCDRSTAGTPGGTDCGYTYQRSSASRPGGRYTVRATIGYTISWTCEGAQCQGNGGTLDDLMTGPPGNLGLIVGEVQTQAQPG
ncbi:hypothetical protein [Actinoallomurus sp. NPDC052274]|uniref:hypothetical protein n=1 Tax=Actinoallomurus sp. NPDC052274 TaxID=3155420 RepID=UPI003448BC65